MKLTGIALLFLMLLGRCTQSTISSAEPLSANELTIRTGTSFGMCVGYCVNEYVFNGTSVTLTQTGRPLAQNPIKTCQTTIDQATWNTLRAAANLETFSKQPETRGCPDCADGGAEYIELQTGEQKHRVTFEYGTTIPGFESLVEALRAQRTAFKACK
ncbi:hypothetical protein [Spirosoma flavum]|uniref:Uncharacterized protein n=1 Tax=Spirosoma flavum TaxID=2048557 RepID=A0ABW6ACH2_9BACT